MNASSKPYDLNFVAAILGLSLAPTETVRNLLRAKKYHFAPLMLALLTGTVFLPLIVRYYTASQFLYKLEVLKSFVLATVISFLLFIFLEALFLRALGVKPGMPDLVSVICFSLGPVTTLVLIIYLLNIWASGTTDYLTFFLSGHAALSSFCITFAFWAKVVCFILSALVFMYGLKYCGEDMYTINAMIITIFSVIPLYCAFFLGVVIADIILPGTTNIYRQLITTPTYLLNV